MTSGSDFIMAMCAKPLSSGSWSEPWNERGVRYFGYEAGEVCTNSQIFFSSFEQYIETFVLCGLTVLQILYTIFHFFFKVNKIIAMDLYKAKVPS